MAKNPCKGMEAMVRMIVGRLHVGESDEAAADYAASRLRKGAAPKDVARVRACAVKIHHENQQLYTAVMRGGRR